MKFETAALLYFSPTGATRKIVRSIARGMGMIAPAEHDITCPQGRSNLPEYLTEDIVVLGMPVYNRALPAMAVKHLEKLQSVGQIAILAVTFGGIGYGSSLKELDSLARKAHLLPMAAGAFPAQHPLSTVQHPVGQGRPDEIDLYKARELGFDVRFTLERRESLPSKRLTLPVNHSMLAQAFGLNHLCAFVPPPNTTANCTQCNRCADGCPAAAIAPDSIAIDPEKCLRCSRCVDVCPFEAMEMEPGSHTKIAILQAIGRSPAAVTTYYAF